MCTNNDFSVIYVDQSNDDCHSVIKSVYNKGISYE